MKLVFRGVLLVIIAVAIFFIVKPRPVVTPELSTDFLLTDELVSYFATELEQPIIDDLGQPIEGFTPAILTSKYSGLQLEDFDGAAALQGEYRYVDGTLEFVFDENEIPHSAADTLNQEGMKTLLSNIADRNEVVIDSESEIDDLIEGLR